MNPHPQGIPFTTTRLSREGTGIFAAVESVTFSAALDAPPDRPFPFVYVIAVSNQSAHAVTIKARKWIIRELGQSRCHVVEGDGVGGRAPRLAPGETFRFHNYHVVAADSVAEGSFLVCDDAGQPALVRVPKFTMSVPKTA